MNWELAKESVVFLGAVILCSVMLPLSLPIYRRLGMVDRPNARSSHTTAIPRGTGLIVVVSFLTVIVAYSAAFDWYPLGELAAMEAFLWSVGLLVILGFLDDRRSVPSAVKLLVQVGCATILVSSGFVYPMPEWLGSFRGIAEVAVTMVWVIGVINAFNFIDGSDGLATTVSALCMLVFVGLSRLLPQPLAASEEARELSRTINLLGLAGVGSAVPFLFHNVSPAKCFLGDTGSTFLGLLLAVLGILTAQYHAVGSQEASSTVAYGYLLAPWLVLLVPIVDGIRVTTGRLMSGTSPFQPDNRHLHHLLHHAGLSANQLLFFVGLVVSACGLLAAVVVRSARSPYLMTGVLVLLVYGLFWFVKSSYRARKFVALALNRRLLHFMTDSEGYENAATFKERFEQELARVRRHESGLTVLIVNTMALRLNQRSANPLANPKFLDHLLRTLRREDIKCRFSDDRLAFLLVETDRELAVHVCERLRRQFDAIRNGESAELQVGIGVASYPHDGGTVTALLQSAESRALSALTVHPQPVPESAGRAGAEEGPSADSLHAASADSDNVGAQGGDGGVGVVSSGNGSSGNGSSGNGSTTIEVLALGLGGAAPSAATGRDGNGGASDGVPAAGELSGGKPVDARKRGPVHRQSFLPRRPRT